MRGSLGSAACRRYRPTVMKRPRIDRLWLLSKRGLHDMKHPRGSCLAKGYARDTPPEDENFQGQPLGS